jgi:starvation-inducible DNA-binding protein
MAQAQPEQKQSGTDQKSGSLKIGLESAERQELALAVSKALTETYVLYTKTQGIHWNVVGPRFYSIHKLTEEQYEDLADAIDKLAERIRALGAATPSSYGEFQQLSDIHEPGELRTAEDAIKMLCTDHETAARTFREATRLADEADDVVTADLLTARMAMHEKNAWMLRALLEDSGVRRTDYRSARSQAQQQKQ